MNFFLVKQLTKKKVKKISKIFLKICFLGSRYGAGTGTGPGTGTVTFSKVGTGTGTITFQKLEPEPELNHNFSKVRTGTGTVINSYGSTTLTAANRKKGFFTTKMHYIFLINEQ